MTSDKDPVTVSDALSFEAVLDDTCDRLWDRKARYSIRRIREMDAALLALEQELDEMLRIRQLRREGNGLGRKRNRVTG
ncbi:hypothetical protein AGMMS49546_28320 [Spirochaetia bacterium]|nr:hypothetical protein AGMMS49546_28320 [Spirochaetia bacterium]